VSSLAACFAYDYRVSRVCTLLLVDGLFALHINTRSLSTHRVLGGAYPTTYGARSSAPVMLAHLNYFNPQTMAILDAAANIFRRRKTEPDT